MLRVFKKQANMPPPEARLQVYQLSILWVRFSRAEGRWKVGQARVRYGVSTEATRLQHEGEHLPRIREDPIAGGNTVEKNYYN
jgi:hypothetical protein